MYDYHSSERKAYMKELNAKNRKTEKGKAAVKSAKQKKPEKYKGLERRSHLWLTYQITQENYDDMLCEQGGCCAICEREPETATPSKPVLYVDHDHKTEKIRGLLCQKCNSGIGFLNDDVNTLQHAIQYIQKQSV